MRRTALVIGTSVLLVSCDTSAPLVGPQDALEVEPQAQLVDGSTTGIAGFYFLPPLAPNPSTGGAFDGSLRPRVEICAGTADPCAESDVMAEYSLFTGKGPERIRVDEDAERYMVNWRPRVFERVAGEPYRLRVFVVNLELGHMDVVFRRGGRSRMTSEGAMELPIGRTVPISFRIERGALSVAGGCDPGDPTVLDCDVGEIPADVGGVVQVMDPATGQVAGVIRVPAGSASEDFTLRLEHISEPPAPSEAIPLGQQYGFFVRVETDPAGVSFGGAGATLTVCQDPALNQTLPLPLHADLRIFRVDDGQTEVLATTVGAPECAGYAALGGPPARDGRPVSILDRLKSGLDRVASLVRPTPLHAAALLHGGLNTIIRGFSSFGAMLGADPDFTTATVPDGVVGTPTTVTVQAADALDRPVTLGGDVVVVSVTGANTETPAVTDNGDGTYTASYTPALAGTDLVAITLNGVPISASPYASAVAGGIALTAIAVGERHACGLSPSGQAYCWGANDFGQLGDGSNTPSNLPIAVSGGITFASLDAVGGFTCGLTPAGAAYCWGLNIGAQLGNGTTIDSSVPTPVSGGFSFSTLSVGTDHTCALVGTGEAYCWGGAPLVGGTSFGREFGMGFVPTEPCVGRRPSFDYTCATTPTTVPTALRFSTIGVGEWHTCAITLQGETYCWGWNPVFCTLGQGEPCLIEDSTPIPQHVVSSEPFVALSSGVGSNCGFTSGGSAYCWGLGTLAGSTDIGVPTPTPLSGAVAFAMVSMSGEDFIYPHACGVSTDGTAYCWGSGGNSQGLWGNLGDGLTPTEECWASSRCTTVPSEVAGGIEFAAVAVGMSFSCGVSTTAEAYCWGVNDQGQLGTGDFESAATPVRVRAP